MDLGEGDRKRRRRNAFVDLAVTAATVAPAKPKTEEEKLLQFAWWLHPNELDLEKVDTPNAEWAPPKVGDKRLAVGIIATKKERDAIIDILNKNFTNAERAKMRGVVIEVKTSAGKGVAGYYQKDATKGYDHIVIGKNWIFRTPDREGPHKGDPIYDDVVTHEVIHFLRARDHATRKGLTHRTKDALFGDDSDLEETFTDGETMARVGRGHLDIGTGYYSRVKKYPPGVRTAEQAMTYDKQLLMGEHAKGAAEGEPKARLDSAGLREDLRAMVNGVDLFAKHKAKGGDKPELARILRAMGYKGRDLKALEKNRAKLHKRILGGKKGRHAIKAIDRNYPNLAIAHAQIKGKQEAIDTYWAHKQATGTTYTHIYSPKANADKKDSVEIARGGAPGDLIEFQDGKKVRVPKTTAGKRRRIRM
jgi:hypothetical protein